MNRREFVKTIFSCLLSYGYSHDSTRALESRTETSYETASMYGHSLNNRSYLPDEKAPAESVGLAWQFKTDDWVISSPVVHDGNLYVGSFDNYLYCLDPKTGDKKWRYESKGRIGTTPCVTSDRLFFGNHNGEVICLSTDGTLLWRRELDDWIRSSPKYADGRLYVAEYMVKDRVPKLDAKIYAFNAYTGKTEWSVKTNDSFYSSPAVSDGVLYIGGLYNGVLRALDTQTGKKLWEYQAEKQIIASPSVVGNCLYLFDEEGLICLNKCGNRLWGVEPADMNLVTTTPAVSENSLFFGDVDGNLYSYNRFTGERNWKRETNYLFYAGGPTLAGNTLLISNHGGEILSVEPETGETVWETCLDSGIRTLPEIKDGKVYFGGHQDMYEGKIYALSIDSQIDSGGCENHSRQTFPHKRIVGKSESME